jgi:hypothetical protein
MLYEFPKEGNHLEHLVVDERNINMDFRETGWDIEGLFYLAQNKGEWRARVNTTVKLRVP